MEYRTHQLFIDVTMTSLLRSNKGRFEDQVGFVDMANFYSKTRLE